MTEDTMHFFVRTDIVVVDHNPEMADATNPRGEIYGEAHYIVGETPDGARIAHAVRATTRNGHVIGDVSPQRLVRLATFLTDKQPPLDADLWHEIEAAYGSPAYQRDGWEEALLAREHEEDRRGW